jgi:heat shock protein HslJ
MSRLLPAALVVLLALGGCAAAQPEPEAAPPASGGSAPLDEDAIALVGLWRVTGAEGADSETFLRLDGTSLIAWAGCGIAMGEWRASGDAFLAGVSGSSGGASCLDDRETGGPTDFLEWLYAARSFRPVPGAAGAELLDADGRTVAVLGVDGAPPSNPHLTDDYLVAPEVTPEVEARFVTPAPLAPGAAPATVADLVGRWEPDVSSAADPPFVSFDDDGTWIGSDGCNGARGRWALGDGGLLLATSGPSTLIACQGAAVPYWVSGASRAGIVDSRLVLVDSLGDRLGELRRA